MLSRRAFFAVGGVAGVAALIRGEEPTPTEFSVPRRVDVRTDNVHAGIPIKIRRHGVELKHVVAYDLDANFAVVYRTSPDGKLLFGQNADDELQHVTLRGGITVEWDREAIQTLNARKNGVRRNG